MAAKNAKPKAKATRKSGSKKKTPAKKTAGMDLGKYLEDIKIGKYSLDDVLEGSSRNMEAVADANRAIIDGYTDIAKRQYEMLKDLLDELRKVAGDRDEVVKDLKRVVEQARKDAQTLQKMASKTNSQAQRIVKKRTDANVKAWKKLIAEAKKTVSGKRAAPKKAAAKKKAAPKRKAAARSKVAPKKKAAPRKKAAAKKRPAASKAKAS